jgi:hypothetical protein
MIEATLSVLNIQGFNRSCKSQFNFKKRLTQKIPENRTYTVVNEKIICFLNQASSVKKKRLHQHYPTCLKNVHKTEAFVLEHQEQQLCRKNICNNV